MGHHTPNLLPFCHALVAYQASVVEPWFAFLACCSQVKILRLTPNEPDMPLKHTTNIVTLPRFDQKSAKIGSVT